MADALPAASAPFQTAALERCAGTRTHHLLPSRQGADASLKCSLNPEHTVPKQTPPKRDAASALFTPAPAAEQAAAEQAAAKKPTRADLDVALAALPGDYVDPDYVVNGMRGHFGGLFTDADEIAVRASFMPAKAFALVLLPHLAVQPSDKPNYLQKHGAGWQWSAAGDAENAHRLATEDEALALSKTIHGSSVVAL